jgi:hypothetical protein
MRWGWLALILVYGFPVSAASFEWFVLCTRRRNQLRHLTVLTAMIFGTASSAVGIWSLLHIRQLGHRPWDDYRFEHWAWLLAAIGAFAAFTWVTVERNWLAWLALASSGWMFLIWSLASLGQ